MSDEKEIGTFALGIAFTGDCFDEQHPDMFEQLIPVFTELNYKCKDIITKPGMYKIELRVVKIK